MMPDPMPTPSITSPIPMAASFRRHGFGVWLAVFYLSWFSIMSLGNFWGSAWKNWPVAVAMAGGSITGGSTPVAGGTVGFPVLVYVFSRPARLGCDFSLAIQSVGMVSASLFILTRGRQIDWRLLKLALLGTAIGTPLGTFLLTPVVSDAAAKTAFAILYASFGILHLIRMRQLVARDGPSPVSYRIDPPMTICVGIAGGMLASVIGVGADMLLYGLLVLLYRADVRIAIPTAVIQMAGTSLIGLTTRLAIGTFSSNEESFLAEVLPYWLAAAPIVVLGGPVGTIVSRHIPRIVLLTLVSLMCIGQYAWTCVQQKFTAKDLLLATLAVAVVSLVLQLLFLRGQRALGELTRLHSQDNSDDSHSSTDPFRMGL